MGYADPETIAADYLKTHVFTSNDDNRVRVVVGEDRDITLQHSQRIVRIVQQASSPFDAEQTLDIADLDVDCFARTRQRARELAFEVRAQLRYQLAKTTHPGSGAFIKQVRTFTPPTEAPWDVHGMHRQRSTYRLWIHHNPLS